MDRWVGKWLAGWVDKWVNGQIDRGHMNGWSLQFAKLLIFCSSWVTVFSAHMALGCTRGGRPLDELKGHSDSSCSTAPKKRLVG